MRHYATPSKCILLVLDIAVVCSDKSQSFQLCANSAFFFLSSFCSRNGKFKTKRFELLEHERNREKNSQHYLVRNSQAATGRRGKRIMWNRREPVLPSHRHCLYAQRTNKMQKTIFRRSFCQHSTAFNHLKNRKIHSTAAAAAAAAFYHYSFLCILMAICGREQKDQNIAVRVASQNGFVLRTRKFIICLNAIEMPRLYFDFETRIAFAVRRRRRKKTYFDSQFATRFIVSYDRVERHEQKTANDKHFFKSNSIELNFIPILCCEGERTRGREREKSAG